MRRVSLKDFEKEINELREDLARSDRKIHHLHIQMEKLVQQLRRVSELQEDLRKAKQAKESNPYKPHEGSPWKLPWPGGWPKPPPAPKWTQHPPTQCNASP